MFSLAVIDVNEAPVLSSNLSFEALENEISYFSFFAEDPDGDSLNYSICTGMMLVTLGTIRTWALFFSQVVDYESPSDRNGDNIYELIFSVSDGELTTSKSGKVTILSQNEAPFGLQLSSNTLPENQPVGSIIGQVSAEDPDGDDLTYSVITAPAIKEISCGDGHTLI